MNKIMTLVVVQQGEKVLLGMKKRGFGAGRWNGFGGKLLPEETIEDGAAREVKEEVEIEVADLDKRGIIEFEFKGNPQILEVHIFKVENFIGDPKETEEMEPKWFSIEKIPFEQMWPDDIFWMPLFFAGKQFKGKFLFGKDDVILSKELEEVASLN